MSERGSAEDGVITSARRLEGLTKTWFTEQWMEMVDLSGRVYKWRRVKFPDILEFHGYDPADSGNNIVSLTLNDSEPLRLVLSRWQVCKEPDEDVYDSLYTIDFNFGRVRSYGGEVRTPRMSLAELEGVLTDLVEAIDAQPIKV